MAKLRRFSAFCQASPNLRGFSLVAAWQILSLPCVLRRNFARTARQHRIFSLCKTPRQNLAILTYLHKKERQNFTASRAATLNARKIKIYRRTSAQNFARLNLSLRKISTAHSRRLRRDKFKIRALSQHSKFRFLQNFNCLCRRKTRNLQNRFMKFRSVSR